MMNRYFWIVTICLSGIITGCGPAKVKEKVGEIACNGGEIHLNTTSYRDSEDNKLYIHLDLVYNGKIVSRSIGRKGFPVGNSAVRFLKVNHKIETGLNIYIDPESITRQEFDNLVRCVQINEHRLVELINEVPNQHITEQELRERKSINALIYGNFEDMGHKFFADKQISDLHVYVAVDGTCQLRNEKKWRTLGRVYEGYLDISQVHYNRIKNYRNAKGLRLGDHLRSSNIRVVYEEN
ncbi:hypothetical protein BKI52_05210 [marine bacterium AO1-C]|nr:hypothetical protein BKI52_05210 [marine bacterium AO1-C]